VTELKQSTDTAVTGASGTAINTDTEQQHVDGNNALAVGSVDVVGTSQNDSTATAEQKESDTSHNAEPPTNSSGSSSESEVDTVPVEPSAVGPVVPTPAPTVTEAPVLEIGAGADVNVDSGCPDSIGQAQQSTGTGATEPDDEKSDVPRNSDSPSPSTEPIATPSPLNSSPTQQQQPHALDAVDDSSGSGSSGHTAID
jgi:hypothetical protein